MVKCNPVCPILFVLPLVLVSSFNLFYLIKRHKLGHRVVLHQIMQLSLWIIFDSQSTIQHTNRKNKSEM